MQTTLHQPSGRPMVVIGPGEFHAAQGDEVVTTLLGSCVSVALHDPRLGCSGLNHFLLPGPFAREGGFASEGGRYGVHAMELLINAMLARGSRKQDLRAKVFGGGHVLQAGRPRAGAIHSSLLAQHERAKAPAPGARALSVPDGNVAFAFAFLAQEGIPEVGHETGGACGRHLFLFSRSGRVQVRRFYGGELAKASEEERAFLRKLRRRRAQGEVTLF